MELRRKSLFRHYQNRKPTRDHSGCVTPGTPIPEDCSPILRLDPQDCMVNEARLDPRNCCFKRLHYSYHDSYHKATAVLVVYGEETMVLKSSRSTEVGLIKTNEVTGFIDKILSRVNHEY